MVLGLDAGILTFAILLAVVFLVIAVNTVIIPEIGSSFLKIATDMPSFEYDNEKGNENFNVYSSLRNISFIIYAIVLAFAGMSYMLEHFNIMSPQTAFTIISKSILFIVLFFIFPPLWDATALSLEQLSAWILNPSDPENAGENVKWIWEKLGSIVPPDISFDKILQFLSNPQLAGEAIFRDVFMAVFKSLVTAILTFLMYVIGIVRIVLTAVLIMFESNYYRIERFMLLSCCHHHHQFESNYYRIERLEKSALTFMAPQFESNYYRIERVPVGWINICRL